MQSGSTQDVIASVELGLATGASVIAITAAESPLVRLASICLPMNSLEDEDLYAPIKSRTAHLAIVDVLAVGVALKRGMNLQKTIPQLRDNQTPLDAVAGPTRRVYIGRVNE